jgi:RNA-directed DNA polymerase
MLEQAKQVPRRGQYTYLEYCRFAAALGLLVDASPQHDWRLAAVDTRLREARALLQVTINEDKRRIVDLAKGASCGCRGFDFRRVRSLQGTGRASYAPQLQKRTGL